MNDTDNNNNNNNNLETDSTTENLIISPENTQNVPSLKAVNVSTLDNNVKCVVGGPLSTSGLPFGHSVLAGDKCGGITLRNVMSGMTRKQIATSYHGSKATALVRANEVSSVTVAEVVIAQDDGSPTLWIGCADGTVQVYFLGGSSKNVNANNNNNSPRNRTSPTSGRKQTPDNIKSSSSPPGALGDDPILSNNYSSSSGSNKVRFSTPTSTSTSTGKNLRPGTASSGGSIRSGISASSSSAAINNTSSRNRSHYRTLSPTTSQYSNINNTSNKLNSPLHHHHHQKSKITAAATNAPSISQDGCALVFAEKRHSGSIQAFVSAPSINSAFTGASDWHIIRWRTCYPFGVIATIGQHSRGIRTLSFSPGNPAILLSGGDDGLIKLWSSKQKKPTELSGHRGSVLCVEPWYDVLGHFGDMFTLGAYNPSSASAASTGVGGAFSSVGSNYGGDSNKNSSSQQQQQKAIGLLSCGEDGTLCLWASDSSVANCVIQVSKSPVVRVQVFSENLVCCFSKDGLASVYSVNDFPNNAICIYRFENVGNVHRSLMMQNRKKSPTATTTKSTKKSGKLSSYLSDVKVLAHINGFLIWSLTSQGARLSLLPMKHFEAITKRKLETIGERRDVIESLLYNETTLDDADSTQSGQLLFQKFLSGGGGGGTSEENDNSENGGGGGFLQQLAKLQQQQFEQAQQAGTSSSPGGAGNDNKGADSAGWSFDPDEADFDVDPGQLSAAETSASSIRSMVRTVNMALAEMSRLVSEFHSKKIDLQVLSFSKVMEKQKLTSLEQFKKESEVLAGKKKEIDRIEKELQVEFGSDFSLSSSNNSNNLHSQMHGVAAKTSTTKSSVTTKVNTRKQIAELLQDMCSGKKNPISASTSLTAKTSSTTSSTTSIAKVNVGEEEKKMIDGISRSVTIEGAASCIYNYIANKQTSAAVENDRSATRALLSGSSGGTTTNSSSSSTKKSSITNTNTNNSSQQQQQHQNSGDLLEMASKCTKLEREVTELKTQLDLVKKEKLLFEQRLEEIPKLSAAFKPMLSSENVGGGRTIGSFASKHNTSSGGKTNEKNNNDNESSHSKESHGALKKEASLIHPISLVVAIDKKLKRRIRAEKEAGKEKSDEEEVANKKDMVADNVVMTVPGVGSWGGAERREKATQTKIFTSASMATQAILLDSNSVMNGNGSSDKNKMNEFDQEYLEHLKKFAGNSSPNSKNNNNSPNNNNNNNSVLVSSPPWTRDEFHLIRQSEENLGKAAKYQGGSGLSDEELLLPEDPTLVEVGRTVNAAMQQLQELERQYQVTQRNVLDFEDSAIASGISLEDPRIIKQIQKLRQEEKFIAEEMSRLHYLLVSPNSPTPGKDGNEVDPNARVMSLTARRHGSPPSGSPRSDVTYGDQSLLKEFKDLMQNERSRLKESGSGKKVKF